MGLLANILAGREEERPAPHDDFWYGDAGSMTRAGVRIGSDMAMRLTAVWSCVRVLAEAAGSLPLFVYERRGDGKVRAVDHPLYQVLHGQPNRHQTAIEWTEMQIAQLALRGNAYNWIDMSGGRLQLVPMHPDRTVPELDSKTDSLVYTYTNAAGKREVYLEEEVLHVKILSMDGLRGLNPIEHQREAMGMAWAAEDYGARFFANDATPRTVIEHPNHFKDDEGYDRFRRRWQKNQAGANRHMTAILEDGLQIKQLGISNEDAQFLETRKFQIAEIARIFRVPLHMINELDRATFSNIEQQSLEFVIFTLLPYLRKIEQAITAKLITRPERYFVEYLAEGLLRGDQAARSAYYSRGIHDGWLTRNEVRVLENRNPLPGLDDPLVPMNMSPSDRAPRDAGAERAARKEVIAVSEAWAARGQHDFAAWACEYYDKLPRFLREQVGLDAAIAEAYCCACVEQLQAADDVPALLADWSLNKAGVLTQLREQSPCAQIA